MKNTDKNQILAALLTEDDLCAVLLAKVPPKLHGNNLLHASLCAYAGDTCMITVQYASPDGLEKAVTTVNTIAEISAPETYWCVFDAQNQKLRYHPNAIRKFTEAGT